MSYLEDEEEQDEKALGLRVVVVALCCGIAAGAAGHAYLWPVKRVAPEPRASIFSDKAAVDRARDEADDLWWEAKRLREENVKLRTDFWELTGKRERERATLEQCILRENKAAKP